MSKTRLIKCPKEDCLGVIGRVYGERLLDVKRSSQRFQFMIDPNSGASITATCPYSNCGVISTITFEDGKLVTKDLRIEEMNGQEDEITIPKEGEDAPPPSVENPTPAVEGEGESNPTPKESIFKKKNG